MINEQGPGRHPFSGAPYRNPDKVISEQGPDRHSLSGALHQRPDVVASKQWSSHFSRRVRGARKIVSESRIRLGSWNVGSLTGKLRELVDTAIRRRVNILCVQETKWTGQKAKEVENTGFKLWYTGKERGRNGVGILIDKSLKSGVVDVRRQGDRIILVKLVLGDLVLNVISAYAPQVGLSESIKIQFWEDLDGMIRSVRTTEKLFIGGDFNGHVGETSGGFERVHGGFGYGDRNQEGEDFLNLAIAYDLMIANTFFRKRQSHLVTFSSAQHFSHIDFVLARREDRRACMDCKVIPGECVVSQHKLVVADFRFPLRSRVGRGARVVKTKWWKLKGDVSHTFRGRMIEEGPWKAGEEANKMWEDMSASIQKKYKLAKKNAKKAVSEARGRAYEDLYQKLSTKEGEKDVYKIAKLQDRKTRDLNQVKSIKDETDRLLVRDDKIKNRWRDYFNKLFNGEDDDLGIVLNDSFDDSNRRFVRRIQESEVKEALKRMKVGKALGPDNIPIEGSALSPYIFALVMDEITKDIQGEIPWCMLFADDVVLVDESKTEVDRKLELWIRTLESKGFRLSRTKTEYMGCEFSGIRPVDGDVCLDGQVVPTKDTFRYLGSMLQSDGEIDEDVSHRIRAGWVKWRQASGVLCDKKVPQKLKGKFYRTAIRPVMLYGAECWATKRRHVQKMSVAEMRMLRWICGHTRKDRIRNDDIRDMVGVAPIEEKLIQHRLRWFGHIQRRPPEAPVRIGILNHFENTRRGRGRPRLTWEEAVKRDLKEWNVSKELAIDRSAWKLAIHVPEP
ncbi:Craniofacial development protein 2 [Rhynchospora pubera]|uniref:Craniofacial development protein 2 n=1 Tax=Rhynchospora pubera TaxID=906938 RepID=A0AAV8E9S6_9POAL|nr:Craniofacial development protein 2 [Rhynchospora pubera]